MIKDSRKNTTIEFSRNKKLNNVLNIIYGDVVEFINSHDSCEDGMKELNHYYKNFSGERDYNLFAYGNLRIYNEDIKDIYKDYESLKNYSVDKLIEIYKRQVGYIVRYILSNKEN